MTGKTLVAYATKGGATEEAALEIADTLRKHELEVDVVNLRKEKNPDVSGYSNVVVGSGVRMGKIYREYHEFLENDFSRKRIALFIVCGEAGDPKDQDRVMEKHMKTTLGNHAHLKPVEFEVFGGRMKVLWKVVSDGRDPAKVRAWAEKVGKKFSSK
ncbi:MAG: hypothetical protein JSV39_04905 [Candidatus Aenigmatarchaeota archaeon]|nr:MAG: hypothetical protein JSV39_04905 [Candidatus Aenigmarchaeota archaeon]